MICPLLSINFFRYPKFSGKQKGSFTKLFVSVLWDNKFRQNPDAPSYAWKVSIKFFFLKHQSVLQWNILVQWDKNFSTENRDTSPPLLSIKIFSLPEIFWNTEWFPGEVFSVLWDKKIFDKTMKGWSPSFAWKFSIPKFFRNTEVFSYEFYRHCETKIFQRSLVISPSYA